MSDSSKYHSFSAADIERYYKGQMSPAERHALEAAALEDPFLADALEGYRHTPSPAADVHHLRERLESKLQRRKLAPRFSQIPGWMKMAALFFLLAGSGWFLYQTGSFQNRGLAKAERAQKKQVPASPAEKPGITEKMARPADDANENRTSGTASDLTRVEWKQKHNTAPQPQREILPGNDNIASASPVQRPTEKRNTAFRQSQRSPLSAATESTDSLAAGNTADSYGFSRMAPAAHPDSVAGWLAGERAPGDSSKAQEVLVQSAKDEMNEVKTVGFGARKKALEKPAARYGELEPAEGWTNFDQYVVSNLKEPEEIKKKPLSGDVELSFDVKKDGQPTNIKVEKSLCSTCDQEAVRLLKEGPKWNYRNDKKGRITIHFNAPPVKNPNLP